MATINRIRRIKPAQIHIHINTTKEWNRDGKNKAYTYTYETKKTEIPSYEWEKKCRRKMSLSRKKWFRL